MHRNRSRFGFCGLQIPTLCTSGDSIQEIPNQRAHSSRQHAPSVQFFINQFVLATIPVTVVGKIIIVSTGISCKLEACACLVAAASCRGPSRITTRTTVSLVRMHFPAHLLHHLLHTFATCLLVRMHPCKVCFHMWTSGYQR